MITIPAEDTFPCLKGEVGVVPCASVLGSFPGISHAAAGWRGALRDADYAIIRVGVVLADAMEMDAGAVGAGRERVADMHDYSVAPVGKERGARDATIDRLRRAREAVRGHRDIGDLKPVLPSYAGIRGFGVIIGRDIKVAPLSFRVVAVLPEQEERAKTSTLL